MKSAKKILEEMAFNKNVPESTKNAFLKHLKHSLNESQKAEVIPMSKKENETQLSFDLEGDSDHFLSKTRKPS